MFMIGESAGFTFLNVGAFGRSFGSCPLAALMAVWISAAAPSMARLRSNCAVIVVSPKPLEETSWVKPEIWANWRSRGVATEEAMVSGLAPDSCADTCTVGNSTCGKADTGRSG